jgi:hypothetical protein
MGKYYYLDLISLGQNQLERAAIEWAIMANWIPISHDMDTDRAVIIAALPTLVVAFQRNFALTN